MRMHRYIYQGRIKQIIETLGLRNETAKLYARLIWGAGREKCTAEIENITTEFNTSNFSEFHRVLYNSGESDVISDILKSHDEDGNLLDVGANIGIYTCFVGKILNKGKTIACEPHPVNYSQLKRNIKLNDINAMAKQTALFDQEGEIQFDMKSTEAGEGHGQINMGSDNNETVDTICGDTLFTSEGYDIPATIKIDVEGAEVNVLAGLIKTLNNPTCERVYCEVHPSHIGNYDNSETDVFDILEDCGFSEQKRFVQGEDSYLVKFTK